MPSPTASQRAVSPVLGVALVLVLTLTLATVVGVASLGTVGQVTSS